MIQHPITAVVRALREPETRRPGAASLRMPALLSISPCMEGGNTHIALPVRRFLILDRSYSMNAVGKLDAAKDATLRLIDGLETGDITVVPFSGAVEDLGTATAGDPGSIRALKSRVSALVAQNNTLLGQALEHALSLVSSGEGITLFVVVSDGQTFDPDVCARAAATCAARGIPIHFIATADVEMDVAQSLTDPTNGMLVYLSRLDMPTLLTHLHEAMSGDASVVVSNLRCIIEPSRGVTVRSVSKSYPDVIPYLPDPRTEIALGHFADRIDVYLELQLPPPSFDGSLEAAVIRVRYDAPQLGLTAREISLPLTIRVAADAHPNANPEVLAAMHRVKAHAELGEAAQEQDPARAAALLESAARRTRIVGDGVKTDEIGVLLANVRKTRLLGDAERKTLVALGRHTRIAS